MSYLPHTAEDRRAMLDALGLDSVDRLFADVPASVRLDRPLALPAGLSEAALLRRLGDFAGQNQGTDRLVSFLGGGATDRFVPSMVGQAVGRAEFLTAYTPYQAEISQGTLQAIWEFQTMMAELTGMDLAQASMYDGASAVAEAALLAAASTGRHRVVVLRSVDPQSRAVLATYASGRGLEVVTVDEGEDGRADLRAVAAALDGETAALVVQDPNFLGLIERAPELAMLAHERGALAVAQVDPIALALLSPPGVWGADIAVGEGQSLGLALGFGGPYLGFFAARESLVRRLPGRLAGATYDTEGRRGFALTFQTREQHIRREKATSNICTNQGLLALAASVYLASLGPAGLHEAAERSLALAHTAARRIAALPGFALASPAPFFDEFLVRAPADAATVEAALLRHGLVGGSDVGDDYPARRGQLLFAVTEQRTEADIERLVSALKEVAA
jgi:glycine dehydrogenase subunit 1